MLNMFINNHHHLLLLLHHLVFLIQQQEFLHEAIVDLLLKVRDYPLLEYYQLVIENKEVQHQLVLFDQVIY